MATFATPSAKFPYPAYPDQFRDIYPAIDKMLGKYKELGVIFIHRVIIVPIAYWSEAVFLYRRFNSRGVLTFQTKKLGISGLLETQHWRVGYEDYATGCLQVWCVDNPKNIEEKYSLGPYGGKNGDEPFKGYQSMPPKEDEETKVWTPGKKTLEMLDSFSEIAGGIISHGSKKSKKVPKRKKDVPLWEIANKWSNYTTEEEEGYV